MDPKWDLFKPDCSLRDTGMDSPQDMDSYVFVTLESSAPQGLTHVGEIKYLLKG